VAAVNLGDLFAEVFYFTTSAVEIMDDSERVRRRKRMPAESRNSWSLRKVRGQLMSNAQLKLDSK
jgi:hypothetical protein